MKDRKHIDDLFKERFENFEATPPADTWDKIAARLPKKEKERRIIPIWWRVAGVAALLALLFTIGSSVFGPDEVNNQLTEEEQQKVENKTVPQKEVNEDIVDDSSQIATDELETETEKDKTEDNTEYTENKAADNLIVPESVDEAVAGVDDIKSDKLPEKGTSEKFRDPVIKEKAIERVVDSDKEAVANTDIEEGKRSGEFSTDKIITDKNVVGQETEKEAVAIAKEGAQKKQDDAANKVDPEIAPNEIIKKDKVVSDKVTSDIAKTTDAKQQEKAEDPSEEKKRSIFDAISENEEEEAVAKTNEPKDRWEITPNVGPVYYSSFGEGSSIDPSFADNSQTGDVNFSYGANVSYAITEKLSVRTGINNVNLSYTTEGLELGTGPVSSAIQSIDYGGRQLVTTAVDIGTLQNNNQGGGEFGNIVPKSAGQEAFLNQSLRYYEVPLELKYSLFNNKFGMHLIGGFSSLFLADNEVSVEAGDFSTVLGEANNLNSLSFTSNIGLGFDYKIGKRLKFNIEPMFKYQLNPYTDSSVDFNPFYLGVYTGLSFKF